MPVATQNIKPFRWNVNPGLIDLNWLWAWRGLMSAFTLWEGGGNPYSHGKYPRLGTNTGGTWVASKSGLALRYTGGAGQELTRPLDGTALTRVSVVVVCRPNENQSNGIFGWSIAANDGHQFIYFDHSVGNLQYYVDNGYRVTVSFPAGALYVIGITYDGATWRMYLDGREVGTYVGGMTWKDYATNIYLGSGYEGPWIGDVICGYVWDRQLALAEIQRLSLDPFGPFRMARRAVVGAAAAFVPRIMVI